MFESVRADSSVVAIDEPGDLAIRGGAQQPDFLECPLTVKLGFAPEAVPFLKSMPGSMSQHPLQVVAGIGQRT